MRTPDREAPDVAEGDLLYGVPAIAQFLGTSVGSARRVVLQPGFPSFKLGKMRCSTKTGANRFLREREREALEAEVS